MADTSAPTAATEPAGDEGLLLDHLRRIEHSRAGCRAAIVHLSRLKPHNRRPQRLRVAGRAFDHLVHDCGAKVYQLAGGDLAVLCRDVGKAEIEAAVERLRPLFGEDPLFGDDEAGGARFATVYDLEAEYAAVRRWATAAAAEAVRRREDAEAGRADIPGRPVAPADLPGLRETLMRTRMSDFIRKQPAIQVEPGGKGAILFREHYVSISELGRRIAPGVDLTASRWLFQYMTETLDRRMLAVIGRRDFGHLQRPLSLNLNVSTVLSPDFHAFDRRVGGRADKVIVELQKIDIFSDMGAYAYARDWLQEKGYRVLIDGLNPLSLQFFDPGLLAADFVKVNWGAEFVVGLGAGRLAEMRDLVRNLGRERVILGRAESEEALKWGLTLGIRRFQGRLVDRLVAALAGKIRSGGT
jgi:EAL domain-containing protein (putative c-di-GMP-specific phosphodiesterase class I)